MTVKLKLVEGVDSSPRRDVRKISISLIDVPSDRQRIDPDFIEALGSDISSNGLIAPIDVVEVGSRFHLVHGAARLAAVRQWGMETIEASVQSGAEFGINAAVRLRSISARMLQRELSILEKSVIVAEWRDLYEQVVGVIKRGRKGISVKLDTNSDEALEALAETFSGTFTEAAKRALDLSQKGVFRALKIASIDAGVRDRIALHAITRNQSELLALAAETADRQAAIADLLLSQPAGASSVLGALFVIDGKLPKQPLATWEKFSQRFTQLKEPEQDRFFEIHAAAIERWRAKRGH